MHLFILLGTILLLGTSAASASGSSFQRSCTNIDLIMEQFNAWIVADCKNGSGGYQNSRVAITGVHNKFGRLMTDNKGVSAFQRSCREAWLEWDHGWVQLVAKCGDGRGGEQQSRVYIDNIHNKNGWLIWEW